jgi:hypothetical protein
MFITHPEVKRDATTRSRAILRRDRRNPFICRLLAIYHFTRRPAIDARQLFSLASRGRFAPQFGRRHSRWPSRFCPSLPPLDGPIRPGHAQNLFELTGVFRGRELTRTNRGQGTVLRPVPPRLRAARAIADGNACTLTLILSRGRRGRGRKEGTFPILSQSPVIEAWGRGVRQVICGTGHCCPDLEVRLSVCRYAPAPGR